MPFAFVRGNPDNLTSGANASMGDIQGPLYDIRDYLNTGLIADLTSSGLLFLGEIRWIGISAPPALWLPANGAAVSRATFSRLFPAIGTVYGVGDGVNTFNVPPIAGRAVIGAGAGAGLTARTAGQQIGEELHQLLSTESGVPGNGSVVNAPDHQHGSSVDNPTNLHTSGGGVFQYNLAAGTDSLGAWVSTPITKPAGAHGHALTAKNADNGHNTMQPSVVIPAYVYAGA
jgi:microcystin-dependent protein